ncbi:hypothetical protein [Blastococcus sp. TBT05-19]|nr:hypothetical protein [Blastococcus sp. TBT05-19]
MTTARKLLASLATIAAAAGLMAFGSLGEITTENAGITRTSSADR